MSAPRLLPARPAARIAALACATALTLAGCSGDATTDPSGSSGAPTGATTATASGSATAAADLSAKSLPEQRKCAYIAPNDLGLADLKLKADQALSYGQKYKDPLTKQTLKSGAWRCTYTRAAAKKDKTWANFIVSYTWDNSPLADRVESWRKGMTDAGGTCEVAPVAAIGGGAAAVTCSTPTNAEEDVFAQFGKLGFTCSLAVGPRPAADQVKGRATEACVKVLETILT